MYYKTSSRSTRTPDIVQFIPGISTYCYHEFRFSRSHPDLRAALNPFECGRSIRVAAPALSPAATAVSPVMLGDFGPNVVRIDPALAKAVHMSTREARLATGLHVQSGP